MKSKKSFPDWARELTSWRNARAFRFVRLRAFEDRERFLRTVISRRFHRGFIKFSRG